MKPANKDSTTKEKQNNIDDNVGNDNELELFWAALMFYTRLRVPHNTPYSADQLNQSRKYFPFIGIIIGAIAVSVYLLCQLFFSNGISVALSMIATILATVMALLVVGRLSKY